MTAAQLKAQQDKFQKELAKKMATDPLGPAPKDADLADLASLTVAANVLLNLDEILMKR